MSEFLAQVQDFLHDVLRNARNPWAVLGFVGQLLFTMRFVVQWIASERRGESYIPVYFWFFSLGGSWLLLIYAIYLENLVFILGQSFGSVVYIRNLVLLNRARKRRAELEEA